MRASTFTFATLIASINALTITSPSAGQTLDPTQPITVTWTSDSSDPATIDILASDPNGFISETRIGRDVSTSSGSFIIPANSIQSYGIGFVVKADGSNGQHLATSAPFDLSVGVGAQVNGQSGLVQSSTFTGAPANTRAASSASGASAAVVTSASVTSSAAIGSSGSSGSSASATASAGESTTLTGSRTGFSTSTMSGTTTRSSSTTHSASSTSASSSSTTSANAQPRLASGSQIVLSGAGLVAGLAALLA